MADVDFDDFEGYYAPRRPAKVQRLINIAGGVSSIALILGLAIWGYRLAVRDVHGIPVVRAIEGPMRIAPDNPGGEIAAHQGLAVNDVPAVGTAAPPPERLVLAPKPVELALEDGPGLEAPSAAPVEASVAATVAPETTVEADLPAPDADATKLALAEALADTVEPEPTMSAPVLPEPETAMPVVEPAPPGAVTRSPVPPPRPARLAPRAAPAPAAAAVPTPTPAAASSRDVDSASLPAGTRLVQLGAFDDAESARREWDRLVGRFGPLLSEKGRVVVSAQSGGRTFYRLRASGFADEADARRFCSALLAEDTACIPVAVR